LAEFYAVRTQDLLPTDAAFAAIVPDSGDREVEINLPRLLTLPSREAGPVARLPSPFSSSAGNAGS
jgi:hypothetical protein